MSENEKITIMNEMFVEINCKGCRVESNISKGFYTTIGLSRDNGYHLQCWTAINMVTNISYHIDTSGSLIKDELICYHRTQIRIITDESELDLLKLSL